MSPLDAPSNSFEEVFNFLLKKGRIQSKPKFNIIPPPPNGEPILGARTFLDVLGNYHTIVLTSSQGYYLNAGGTYLALTTPFTGNTLLPFAMEGMLNKAFFSNGGQTVAYVEGEADFVTAAATPASAFFLGKLNAHLILLHTVENGTTFPQRIRWSKSGDPTNWTDFSAGLNDVPDIDDQITGFTVLGETGFVMRNEGIIVMSGTGNGLIPFSFDNFSIGPAGIGVQYPYTLVTYGRRCGFVATDDVYLFSGGEPQGIGGFAKKMIFRDLYARVAEPRAWITATLGKGIDFMAYWLSIPLTNDEDRLYIFNFNENNWTSMKIPALGRISWSGYVATG